MLQTTMRVIFALLIVTSYLVAVKSYKYSALSDVHKCSRYQPDLEICIARSIESMKPYLKWGIMDIPSIDNYVIETYEFEWIMPYPKPHNGHMLLKELHFNGLLNHTISQIKASPDMKYIEFQAYFPLIKLDAVYDIMFAKPVPDVLVEQSKKIMYANFTDVTATITIVGNYYTNYNIEYFQLYTVKVYFNISSYNIFFTQLDEYPEILNVQNVIMYELFQSVKEQLKGTFQVDAAEMIKDYLNKIYERFSIDVLMPS